MHSTSDIFCLFHCIQATSDSSIYLSSSTLHSFTFIQFSAVILLPVCFHLVIFVFAEYFVAFEFSFGLCLHSAFEICIIIIIVRFIWFGRILDFSMNYMCAMYIFYWLWFVSIFSLLLLFCTSIHLYCCRFISNSFSVLAFFICLFYFFLLFISIEHTLFISSRYGSHSVR